MNDALTRLNDAGVSIWLDDLSRDRIESGNLAHLIADSHVVGVTTNPTIFAHALTSGKRYDRQLAELAHAHANTPEAVFELITTDVRLACDIFAPAFEASDGVDGRVSIEVAPDLADDTAATVASARRIREAVDRRNCYIKIPATPAGFPAIRACLGEGIDVNVTLIFGLEQYDAVLEAFIGGLEDARDGGLDISTIHSVASFFVSRVDTEVDARLRARNAPGELFGQAGIANARLAYAAQDAKFGTDRWAALQEKGARPQRPLWASTGVKDPTYRDTMYVEELAGPGTVMTLPEATLRSVADHGIITGDRVTAHRAESRAVLDTLMAAGIDYPDVIDTLTRQGIQKFERDWRRVATTVDGGLGRGDETGHRLPPSA
jgi:transaldolase